MKFLLIICCVIGSSLQCPDQDPNLLDWNNPTAWEGGTVPQLDSDATLIKSVLLNSQPPILRELTIASGAKLVFDPTTDVHLQVHAIYIDGEFHIGSETCLFEGNAHITFLGEIGEEKILLVRTGGTFEVHGSRKLPWTKLDGTAPKLQKTPDILEGKDNLDFCNDKCQDGLLVYQIDPSSGQLIAAHIFDFTVLNEEIDERINQFVDYLGDIPVGRIVGIGLKKQIVDNKEHDLTRVFQAIEDLVDTDVESQLRGVDRGSAFALFAVKGDKSKTVEVFESNVKAHHSVTAKLYQGDYAYVMESYVRNLGMGCENKVELHVYDDALYRPTITLLDEVTTWLPGDKLIVASTDYNPEQAEEVTVLSIPSSHQVRLTEPLKFTHYGNIYKGVDMRGEVGLLSRNVKFDSKEASTSDFYGGHIKVLKDFASVHIEGAELEGLGQQEVLGAYSIHFHMCEDVSQPRPWIRQNSIHHSKSRCITIHHTMGLIIEQNVCYRTIGHSYFFEAGSEQNTIMEGNLGLGTSKPPPGRGLIPTDTACPTTYWVTNPKNSFRKNVAAGSFCRGFWFNFPDDPLLPDSYTGNAYMLNKEARFTAIHQFDDNTAHSNGGAGGFWDNILKPNGKSEGYNQYRPMKNPVENNCIANPKGCEDDCVYLRRFTAYKNVRQNAWVRGGCMKLVESSFSDSLSSVVLLRDTPAYQFLEKSIIVGDSDNFGEPETFLSPTVNLQRSFPFGRSMGNRNLLHVGVEFMKGPVYITDVRFEDFKDTDGYYQMGALGFRRNNVAKSSARSTVKNAQFGFADPTEGNRVKDYDNDDDLYTERDGDDIANFRDADRSVTRTDVCSEAVAVVRPEPFHMTPECYERTSWNMAWCCQNFGEIRVQDSSSTNDAHLVTMVRDDVSTAMMESDMEHNAPFLVILGGQYSYSMFFNNQIPNPVKILTEAVSNSGYVRVGVCLPPNAEFQLKIFHPSTFRTIDKWTLVDNIHDLDSDTDGGKYFYDKNTGYFATVFRNQNDFLDDEYHPNPRNRAIQLTIDIKSGDRAGNDCLSNARNSFGDLSPKVSLKRNLKALLRSLLNDVRAKRSISGEDNNREIPADGAIPSEWGAGSTHTPWVTPA
ncbi:cell migration-inducing and hyaluronan-binding protein-like [Mytilus trossulus]|uniref:cell migration-inducing and hyaluronan-binding protein-like n=1 Tax=Mytilus trossulus TaxID=6551 RepID=UPI0030042301